MNTSVADAQRAKESDRPCTPLIRWRSRHRPAAISARLLRCRHWNHRIYALRGLHGGRDFDWTIAYLRSDGVSDSTIHLREKRAVHYGRDRDLTACH
jgi:hypothetical protein